MGEAKKKFTVVGIVTSMEYQKCKFYVKKLVKSFPKEYDAPVIRPMLNVEWKEYLWKIRRNIGGKVWTLEKNAVVLLNNEFLGDDVAIFNYASNKARFRVVEDFHCLGILELRDIINKAIDNKRRFAYFAIAIEGKCIGTLLFLLYADHVPKTVHHFLRRCKSKKRGWVGRPLHRLVKESWLQIGGFDLENRKMPCENYIVPHDRRGVLSTCNEGNHTNNTTQLILSLASTPWMDYKFVAFGQLIHGDEILKKIEAIETYYEAPKKSITVWQCGEYNLDTSPDIVTAMEIKTHLEKINSYTGLPDDVIDPKDVPSDLSAEKYRQGLYCLDIDLQPHPALNKWHLYYETAHRGYDLIEEDYDLSQTLCRGILQDIERRIKLNVPLDPSDDIKEIDKDMQGILEQLLSKEIVGFKTESRPSKSVTLEKIQKLDIEHMPREVIDIVESILQHHISFRTKSKSRSEGPLIHHIAE